jgi:hypothetical protein
MSTSSHKITLADITQTWLEETYPDINWASRRSIINGAAFYSARRWNFLQVGMYCVKHDGFDVVSYWTIESDKMYASEGKWNPINLKIPGASFDILKPLIAHYIEEIRQDRIKEFFP